MVCPNYEVQNDRCRALNIALNTVDIQKPCLDLDDPNFCLFFLREKVQTNQKLQDLASLVTYPEAFRLINEGNELRLSGQLDKAETILKEAVERYPEVAGSYHYLALVYSNQNRLEIAQRYYELGLERNPNYSDYYNDYGVLLMKRQNFSGARILLRIASEIDPQSYRPWINLGAVNAQEGRLEHAYRCFQIVLRLNPGHQNVRERLKLLEEEFSPSFIEKLASEREINLNQESLWIEQSTVSSSTVEAIKKPNISPLWTDAQSRYAKGDLVGAFSVFETLHKLIPANVDVLHNMGVIKEGLADIPAAIKIYHKILQLEPKNHDALANLSNIYFKKENNVEAKKNASNALIADPNSPLARFLLAQALHAEEEYIEAAALLREALVLVKPMSKVEVKIRSLLSTIEKQQSPSELAEIAYNKACEMIEKEKLEESLALFEEAISHNPTFLDAHYNLAVTLFKLERFDEARLKYEVVLKLRPHDLDALNNLGVIYAMDNNLDKAKSLFDEALNIDEDFALTHRNLAAYYQAIGNTAKLNEHAKRALELDKNIFD